MTDLPIQALQHTVQEFPPPDNTGLLFTSIVRGPILPPYGTKERDRILRIMHRNEYNGVWQGAVAGLIKRIKSTKWELRGNDKSREYFQKVFTEAQFGQGWGTLISRTLEDYLCQDYGAFWELIGPGHPSGPLTGRVEGIAHLDAGRTYVTGNPMYPVLYYSLMTGRLHKIHHSRLVRIVDMPNPDERYFGIGLCALSRAIAVCQREVRMGQYIDMLLDDKPKPGIALVQGMTAPQRQQTIEAYMREQQSDERPVWGKVLWFHSINIDNPIDIKTIPFAETPEHYDFVKFTELDVNAIALALGVDRQELWELQGKSVGTSAQSQVLAQKSQGKAYADMLNSIERIINLTILPEDLEFRFKFKDPFADKSQAQIDAMYMQIAQGMAAIPGGFSVQEIRRFLANKSMSYEDVLSNRAPVMAVPDDDLVPPPEQPVGSATPSGQPVTPAEGSGTPADNASANRSPGQQQQAAPVTQPKKRIINAEAEKSFWLTSFDWSEKFIDYVSAAQKGTYSPRQLYVLLLSELEDMGEKAFADGLIEGGVSDPLDKDDKALVQAWLSTQTNYLSRFVEEVTTTGISDVKDRAKLWANKSLREIYYAGKRSADRNGMYEWQYGPTEHCKDCSRLNGQRHRLKEYYRRGWIPGNSRLDCGGYRCQCRLVKTSAAAKGRF